MAGTALGSDDTSKKDPRVRILSCGDDMMCTPGWTSTSLQSWTMKMLVLIDLLLYLASLEENELELRTRLDYYPILDSEFLFDRT